MQLPAIIVSCDSIDRDVYAILGRLPLSDVGLERSAKAVYRGSFTLPRVFRRHSQASPSLRKHEPPVVVCGADLLASLSVTMAPKSSHSRARVHPAGYSAHGHV